MRKSSSVAVILVFTIAGFGFGLLHAQDASQPSAQQTAQEKIQAPDVRDPYAANRCPPKMTEVVWVSSDVKQFEQISTCADSPFISGPGASTQALGKQR